MGDNDLQHLQAIMKDVRVAMVTTTSSDGSLTSRPMATQQADFDGDAWFITARDSDLAQEVATGSQVNVAYSGASSWLSLSGRAEVVVDEAMKADLWNTVVEAWFPGGKDDESIVLLKVSGESGQYWDSPGRVAQAVDMARARITGQQAGDVGESGTVQL